MLLLILDLIFLFFFILSLIFLVLDIIFKEDSYKTEETTYTFFFLLFCFTLGYQIGKIIY